MAVLRIALVGEQPPYIHIGALGQGRPDHLVAQARDPHGVGAGERQYRPKGTLLRSSWLKQQGFLVQMNETIYSDQYSRSPCALSDQGEACCKWAGTCLKWPACGYATTTWMTNKCHAVILDSEIYLKTSH